MNKTILYVSIVLAGVLLGLLHVKLKPEPDEKTLRMFSEGMANTTHWQGRYPPDFTLATTHGEHFKLSENIGKKVIVLNFFATWCGPCREEMPELNRYFNSHKSDPFILIGIDSEESPEKVDDFISQVKLDFPVGIDAGAIQKAYGVSAFPTTVLIGVDGRVQFYESGALSNGEVAFDGFLKPNLELLRQGKTISTAEYLTRVQNQPPSLGAQPKKQDEEPDKLDERGQRIAGRMVCPCGCDDKVLVCKCNTAQQIRKALATEDFKQQSDDEIIRALNKRFCSGAM